MTILSSDQFLDLKAAAPETAIKIARTYIHFARQNLTHLDPGLTDEIWRKHCSLIKEAAFSIGDQKTGRMCLYAEGLSLDSPQNEARRQVIKDEINEVLSKSQRDIITVDSQGELDKIKTG